MKRQEKDSIAQFKDPKTGKVGQLNLTTGERTDLDNVNGMTFKHRPESK